MSDYELPKANSGDAELQEFLMQEKQKAQLSAQVTFKKSYSYTKFNHCITIC